MAHAMGEVEDWESEGGYIVQEEDRLLTPAEVAERLRVDVKTVARWAHAGLLDYIRTPGGHRRYRESDISELLKKKDKSG